MIPQSYIQEWTPTAPWPDLRQVEQDLIICRALCDLFNSPALAGKIAFRGGTALHKLIFQKPLRYSEDIDLLQIPSEPIQELFDGIGNALSWLGKFKYEQAKHSTHLIYRFSPEIDPATDLKLKIEINTREHESLYGFKKHAFRMDSSWHGAEAEIISFETEELLATKFRALLQRRKGRDLFDLNEGLRQLSVDPDRLVSCFERYMALEGNSISRAEAEERMLDKLSQSLTEDIAPLLPAGVSFTDDDAIEAFGRVWGELVTRIKGEPWKQTEKIVADLREARFPKLLLEYVP